MFVWGALAEGEGFEFSVRIPCGASARCVKNPETPARTELDCGRERSVAVHAPWRPPTPVAQASPPTPLAMRRQRGRGRDSADAVAHRTEGHMANSNPQNTLTDTQLVLLSASSQRDDGVLIPPETIKGP